MASIKREIKHTLGLEGGKKAVDGLLDKLKAEYGSIFSDRSACSPYVAIAPYGLGLRLCARAFRPCAHTPTQLR